MTRIMMNDEETNLTVSEAFGAGDVNVVSQAIEIFFRSGVSKITFDGLDVDIYAQTGDKGSDKH